MDDAIAHCTRGLSTWKWASNDEDIEPAHGMDNTTFIKHFTEDMPEISDWVWTE